MSVHYGARRVNNTNQHVICVDCTFTNCLVTKEDADTVISYIKSYCPEYKEVKHGSTKTKRRRTT